MQDLNLRPPACRTVSDTAHIPADSLPNPMIWSLVATNDRVGFYQTGEPLCDRKTAANGSQTGQQPGQKTRHGEFSARTELLSEKKSQRGRVTQKLAFLSLGLKNRAIDPSKTFWPTITQNKIVSRPLPTPPIGTSQGPTRELSQGTGRFPLNPIFTGRTSVSRFLRKLKRGASRIRVTRPSRRF
jgi:hypothetical protein